MRDLLVVSVLRGIFQRVLQSLQQRSTKGRVRQLIASLIPVKHTLHRALKGNDRVASGLDLALHLIYNGIHLQRQQQLLGVVIGFRGEGHVVQPHLVRTLSLLGAAHRSGHLAAQLLDIGVNVILLELDNGVEGHNRLVIVALRTRHGLSLAHRLPVRLHVAHIPFAAHHLTHGAQSAAHNLLKRHAALLDNLNQLVRLHVGLAHGRTDSVQRHRVGPLGKRSAGKRSRLGYAHDALQVHTGIAVAGSGVTLIQQQDVILGQSAQERRLRALLDATFALLLGSAFAALGSHLCSLSLAHLVTLVQLRIGQHRKVIPFRQLVTFQRLSHLNVRQRLVHRLVLSVLDVTVVVEDERP